jgi:hypothetical protein
LIGRFFRRCGGLLCGSGQADGAATCCDDRS